MIAIIKPSISLRFLSACIVLAGLSYQAVLAQEVEEVVVEAERSENALVDDLTSASVLDGEKLADAGIENVEDVAAYVPNLVLAETSTGTNIVIRGIGAGVNQGFDQSVGLYADGVPLPRSQMARSPFLDLAGVQVLRGPQYVTDGNFSIAGSVHMISRAAADEFELDLDFTTIPSQNDRKMLLTFGTPITDRMGLRMAVERKVSDGYVENVARNEDGPQSDNLFIRSVLNFAASEDLSFKLKYETGSFDTVGRQIEIIESQATPDFRTLYNGTATPPGETDARSTVPLAGESLQLLPGYAREIDYLLANTFYAAGYNGPQQRPGTPGFNQAPRTAAFAGRSYLQVLNDIYTGTLPDDPDGTPSQTGIQGIPFYAPDFDFANASAPAGLLDDDVDFRRAADADEFSNNDSTNITLNADYRLGDHELNFVASFIDYEVVERIDTDFTPVPILFTDQDETYEQYFYKFEWTSPADAFIQFKAGASYLDAELEFNQTISNELDGPSSQEEAAQFLFDMANQGTQALIDAYDAQYVTFDPERPFVPYFGRTNRGAIQALEFFDLDRQFTQDSAITAVFLQAKVNWSDRFRTTFGARYTHSEKNAVRDLAFLLSNGEAFNQEGIDFASGLVANSGGAVSNADIEQQFDNLVRNLGLVYNFQPHTDRIPTLGFYRQSVFEPNQVIPSPVSTECLQNWSYALGGACDPNGGRRREEQLLPSMSLEFDVTPDLSMYAAVQMANKLGGYDAQSISTPRGVALYRVDPGTFEYEDEDAITYEIGASWFLPGGFGELRAAAFYTDFSDLQVSSADRSVGQNVRNAATAVTKGVEIEGLLQLTDQFNINYSLAWIEFEFGDYPIAACELNERADGILITSASPGTFYGQLGDVAPIYYETADAIDETLQNVDPLQQFILGYRQTPQDDSRYFVFVDQFGQEGVSDVLPAGATELFQFGGANSYASSSLGPRVCQFEGRTNQYVADVQGTFSFNYRKEVNALGFMFEPTLDVLYNSGYETTVRLDSDVAQDEYIQLNGRLGFSSLEESWEVAIVAQNMTNEKVVSYASEVPIATRLQGSKTHFGFVRPPRSVGLNFRYKFY